MLSHSGQWDWNLGAADSKACLVLARLPVLLYLERVVEGLRRGRNPARNHSSDPGRGLRPPRGRGAFFLISTEMLSGLEVALSGLKSGTLQKLGGTVPSFPLTS